MTTFVEQIGGSHYKAEYQHWDLALDIEMGPLEYAATKYTTRWDKKNGAQDVKKAISYIDKLIVSDKEKDILSQLLRCNFLEVSDAKISRCLGKFFLANDIDAISLEGRIISAICRWDYTEDLEKVRVLLLELLEKAQETEASSSYVNQ